MSIKRKIIITDDDANLANALADLFSFHGYEICVLPDSHMVIGNIKNEKPDIAIISSDLNNMSGIDIIREINTSPNNIRWILITNDISQITTDLTSDLGVSAYFQKPLNYEQVLLSVKRTIELIQTQEELKVIETRYCMMTESIQEIVWLMDMEFTYLWVSPSVFRLLGYTADELNQMPAERLLGPSSALMLEKQKVEKIKPELLEDPTAEIIICGEFEYYKKNASAIWCDTTITLLRGAEEEPIGFLGIGRDITERKKSEQALFQEKQLLRTIIDNLPVGIYAKDTECRKILANRIEYDYVGATSDADIIGKNDWELYPQELAEKYYLDDISVIHKGLSIIEQEEILIDKEGKIRWIMTSKIPLKDQTDQIIGLVGINLDITERKQTEELINNLNFWFKGMIESADSPIFSIDRNYCYTNFNLRHAAVIKDLYDEEIVIGKNFFEDDRIYNDFSSAKSDFDRALNGEQFRYESSIKNQNLQMLQYFEVTYNPIRDPKGKIVGVAVFTRDITEQKKAEEALRQSENKLTQIINASPDAIFLNNAENGRIIEVNQTTMKIYGYSQEELIGHTSMDIGLYVHPEDREVIYKNLSDQDSITNIHVQLRKKSGEILASSISANSLFINKEKYYLFNIRDISQQKMLESRLYQAQKLESIGQLAAGIAHEINTPTQFVGDNLKFLETSFYDIAGHLKTYKELLINNIEDGVNSEITGKILEGEKTLDLEYLTSEIPIAIQQSLEGIRRITEIVNAMKSFSHPGGEKMAVDVNKSIQDTITIARNEWKYFSIVETHLAENIPYLLGYPDELNQVFLNIIVNAAQAIASMENHHSNQLEKIIISTVLQNEWVEIRIKDSGPGIPEQIRSKIFDPFFTTKDIGKGTGQGLAIAYDVVVQKHKGTLTFESEIGKGTEFIIRLPLNSED